MFYMVAIALKKLYPGSDIDYNDVSLASPKRKSFKNVIFGNNVLIGRSVKIGKNSKIGANSIIESNVKIGKSALWGMDQ